MKVGGIPDLTTVLGSPLFSHRVGRFLPRPVQRRIFPTKLVIEPVASCNLSCVFCPQGSMERVRGKMDTGEFKVVLDRIPNLREVTFSWMGEPLLHEHIFDMVEEAASRGLETTIDSNATLLRERYREVLGGDLSTMRISLDGFSQETIEKYRGGADFEEIKKGIELLFENAGPDSPELYLRFLVFDHNEHEISEVRDFAREIGADLSLGSPALVYWGSDRDYERMDWMADDERFRRYEETEDGYKLKNPASCPAYLNSLTVAWDGRVVPCCFDVNADYAQGNVLDDDFDFEEVYWGEEYTELREKMRRKSLPICDKCNAAYNVDVEVEV